MVSEKVPLSAANILVVLGLSACPCRWGRFLIRALGDAAAEGRAGMAAKGLAGWNLLLCRGVDVRRRQRELTLERE